MAITKLDHRYTIRGIGNGPRSRDPKLTDPSFLANRASYWFVLLHISTVCGTLLTWGGKKYEEDSFLDFNERSSSYFYL